MEPGGDVHSGVIFVALCTGEQGLAGGEQSSAAEFDVMISDRLWAERPWSSVQHGERLIK